MINAEKITPILKEKLQPHAKRIADGTANDHDYLPAMLLTCIEGNSQNVAVIKGLVDSNNQLISQSNENITLIKALNNKINILTIATALFAAITLAMIIYQMLNK